MISQPASVFIIVFTAINIAACLWLMWWTARTRVPGQASGASNEDGVGNTGHVWDGDLEELNNPLPRWWLGLFIITVLFGAAYLIIYPGMGNYGGTGQWSSVGAHDAQVQQQRENFEARLAPLKQRSLQQLAGDSGAMSMARNLFNANCAGCHGSDARGAKGFPNLADKDWLWGGGEDRILETIAEGRHGVMPALGPALPGNAINEVASYVVSLSGGKAPEDWIEAGEARFQTICVACHGADAKGNALLGAPNLTDKVWLHGGDFDTIRATITNGRDNQMPAHRELLGDTKVKLLAAYVLQLSGGDHATGTQASAP